MSAATWSSLTVAIRMIQSGPRPSVMGRNPPQVHRPSGGDNLLGKTRLSLSPTVLFLPACIDVTTSSQARRPCYLSVGYALSALHLDH